MFKKISIFTCLLTIMVSCSQSADYSDLASTPQDTRLKYVKVPLPANLHSFSEDAPFPDSIPLVISNQSGSTEPLAFWVLAHDAQEEAAIISGLGLDYSKFANMQPALVSADEYNPSPDPVARKADQDKFCSRSTIRDKALCSMFKYAPELQSVLIGPKSLPFVDGGYEVAVYNTGAKSYLQYSQGLASLKMVDLGCQEVKKALLPAGTEDLQETSINEEFSDLNCVNGTTVAKDTLESQCIAARAGQAPAELMTLNTLLFRLGISQETACKDITASMSAALTSHKNELDLSNAGITSLKLLRYLPPTVADIIALNLSGNPELGSGDSDTGGVLDEVRRIVSLTKIKVKGTKISNLLGLKDLQFLKAEAGALDIAWPFIAPAACPVEAVSQSLRAACQGLQEPIQVKRLDGGTTSLVINKLSEGQIATKGEHKYAELLGTTGFQYAITAATCAATQDSGRIALTAFPGQSCSVEIEVKGGRLKPGKLRVEFSPVCGVALGKDRQNVTTSFGTVAYECVTTANAIERIVVDGTCTSPLEDFELASIQCVPKRCANGQKIEATWPATVTGGSFTEQCTLVNGAPTVGLKPGSGHCDDGRYDFAESDKSCVLKRCANGRILNETWLEKDPRVSDGQREFTCTSGEPIPGKVVCDKGFLERNGSCQRACDDTHAVGDAPWKGYHGTMVCNYNTIKPLSCDSGFIKSYDRCDGTVLKRRLDNGTLFTVLHVTDRYHWNSSPENPIEVYVAVNDSGEIAQPRSSQTTLNEFTNSIDNLDRLSSLSPGGSVLIVCNDLLQPNTPLSLHASPSSSPFSHGMSFMNGQCVSLGIQSLRYTPGSTYEHSMAASGISSKDVLIHFKFTKINPRGEVVP